MIYLIFSQMLLEFLELIIIQNENVWQNKSITKKQNFKNLKAHSTKKYQILLEYIISFEFDKS